MCDRVACLLTLYSALRKRFLNFQNRSNPPQSHLRGSGENLKTYCNLSTAVQCSPLNQFLLENPFFRLPRPPLTSFHNGLGRAGGLCDRSVEAGVRRAPVPECCSLAGVRFSVIRRRDSAFCHFHLMMAGFCFLQQLSCLNSHWELCPPRDSNCCLCCFFQLPAAAFIALPLGVLSTHVVEMSAKL